MFRDVSKNLYKIFSLMSILHQNTAQKLWNSWLSIKSIFFKPLNVKIFKRSQIGNFYQQPVDLYESVFKILFVLLAEIFLFSPRILIQHSLVFIGNDILVDKPTTLDAICPPNIFVNYCKIFYIRATIYETPFYKFVALFWTIVGLLTVMKWLLMTEPVT